MFIEESESNLRVNIKLSFVELNKILREAVVGQDLGKGFVLKSINMGAEGDYFIVHLQMVDKITTPIKAKFQIIYDNVAKRFKLERLDVKLQSDSIFSMGANLIVKLLRNVLDKKIEGAINEKFSELLDQVLHPPGPIQVKDNLSIRTYFREIEIYEVHPSDTYLKAIGIVNGHLGVLLGD